MFGAIDEMLKYVVLFRTCLLGGRYGGGKTALAVHMAIELVRQRHAISICSNLPLNLGVEGEPVSRAEVQESRDSVIILDESWLELGKGVDSKKLRSWLAYLRKHNQYVLLPSVMELTSQVSQFSVERRYNLLQLGLPVWVYQWKLTTGRHTQKNGENGWFYWMRPTRIFGAYDHIWKPDDEHYWRYTFG